VPASFVPANMRWFGRRRRDMLRPTQRTTLETAMINLYAMGSPNVVKIYIELEEMGLPYTVHPVDVFGEEQFKPEFLRLNPVAKVPGSGTIICTVLNGRIFQWLAP
jgi:hypothetical protein